MAAKSGNLTARMERVALALAAGKTMKRAAAEVGISERTVRSWLSLHPAFRGRVQELRSELFGAAVGRLAGLATRAAATLGRLLRSANDNVRLGAAKCILEAGGRLRDAVEFADRLSKVEQALEMKGSKPCGPRAAG